MTIRFNWPVTHGDGPLPLGSRNGRERLTGAALVLLATACGADGGTTQSVDVVQQEFSTGDCMWVTADQVFQNKIDPAFVTPSSYDTCDKGYVVDIRELSPDYTGDGEYTSAALSVSLTDAITTQTACERTKLMSIYYREEWNSGTSSGGPGYAYWSPFFEDTRYGTWSSDRCYLGLQFNRDWVAGESYRVAVSAVDSRRRRRSVTLRTLPPTDM